MGFYTTIPPITQITHSKREPQNFAESTDGEGDLLTAMDSAMEGEGDLLTTLSDRTLSAAVEALPMLRVGFREALVSIFSNSFPHPLRWAISVAVSRDLEVNVGSAPASTNGFTIASREY